MLIIYSSINNSMNYLYVEKYTLFLKSMLSTQRSTRYTNKLKRCQLPLLLFILLFLRLLFFISSKESHYYTSAAEFCMRQQRRNEIAEIGHNGEHKSCFVSFICGWFFSILTPPTYFSVSSHASRSK